MATPHGLTTGDGSDSEVSTASEIECWNPSQKVRHCHAHTYLFLLPIGHLAQATIRSVAIVRQVKQVINIDIDSLHSNLVYQFSTYYGSNSSCNSVTSHLATCRNF